MADPSESTLPLENRRSVLEPSCCMSASSDSAFVTALASESEFAIPSFSTAFFPARSKSMSNERRKAESGVDKSVEDAIERSKVHWSQLTEHSESDKEEAKVRNVEVFQSLQMHPTWGGFFPTFGNGGIFNVGELEVGEKFAKGAQAELYHAHVTWKNPEQTFEDKEHGKKYVLKVFRKGTFLRDLQKQWPKGIFQQDEEISKRTEGGLYQPTKYTSSIECRTLLANGQFAFLLTREHGDLRIFIDQCLKARANIDCGPFSREMEIRIMLIIARGMCELHRLNIVHRDLKASNVLCGHVIKKMDKYFYDFNVAFEEVVVGYNCNFLLLTLSARLELLELASLELQKYCKLSKIRW